MSRSGTVRANGQELYYEVHGEGQPLILVMGLGYDSTLWTLAQVPDCLRSFRSSSSTTAMLAAARKPPARTRSRTWPTTRPR